MNGIGSPAVESCDAGIRGRTPGILISVSLVLDTFGAPAFFAYTSSVHGILILVTFMRRVIRPEVADEGRSSFAFLLNSSPVFVRMATRKNGSKEDKPPETPA